MKNYYSSLAGDKMREAQLALEKADEYIALASRNGSDYGFRRNLSKSKKLIAKELERLATIMADKDLSS